MKTNNKNNYFNNPVVVILTIALLGLGSYVLFSNKSKTSTTSENITTNPIISNIHETTSRNTQPTTNIEIKKPTSIEKLQPNNTAVNTQQPNIIKQNQSDNLQQANDFDLQQKCSNAAEIFYKKNTANSTNNNIANGYISHWNKSLDECFIELSSSIQGNVVDWQLADAIGGTIYADLAYTVPNEDNPKWCEIYPEGYSNLSDFKKCSSKTEFDSYVSPFMNN